MQNNERKHTDKIKDKGIDINSIAFSGLYDIGNKLVGFH